MNNEVHACSRCHAVSENACDLLLPEAPPGGYVYIKVTTDQFEQIGGNWYCRECAEIINHGYSLSLREKTQSQKSFEELGGAWRDFLLAVAGTQPFKFILGHFKRR